MYIYILHHIIYYILIYIIIYIIILYHIYYHILHILYCTCTYKQINKYIYIYIINRIQTAPIVAFLWVGFQPS